MLVRNGQLYPFYSSELTGVRPQDRLLKIILQQVQSGECAQSVCSMSEVQLHVSMPIELWLGSTPY